VAQSCAAVARHPYAPVLDARVEHITSPVFEAKDVEIIEEPAH
jgi:hypothetical protein